MWPDWFIFVKELVPNFHANFWGHFEKCLNINKSYFGNYSKNELALIPSSSPTGCGCTYAHDLTFVRVASCQIILANERNVSTIFWSINKRLYSRSFSLTTMFLNGSVWGICFGMTRLPFNIWSCGTLKSCQRWLKIRTIPYKPFKNS